MPCWYFVKNELLHSPSKADGISSETESRYREEGAGFIIELANKLGIQYDTYAAAVVYFHRFHVLQSFRNFHRHVTATSCLLLSTKTQENKTTLQDLLKTIKLLLSEDQFSVFGTDPQQEVVQTEMSLLETLKFDLSVIHPYAYLLQYTKLLKGEKDIIQQILHTSWTFVNDSLYTTLCIQYEPDLLAVAFLYLACRLTKFKVTEWTGKPDDYTGKWYSHFVSDMNIEILKDICGQVLGLYSKGQKDAPLVTRRSSSRGREVRSPSPVHSSRRRSGSPVQRRIGRRSLSPLPRRPADSNALGRGRLYDIERSSSSRSRRSSHSRSRSYHRRSYSRSPEWRRLDRSVQRSRSPQSPPVRLPPEPGTFFLSRESFEEVQAQLKAKSSQPPPESYIPYALPPPAHFGLVPQPMQQYVPPSYPPVGVRQPPPQVVIAIPLHPPQAMPPASHPPFQPGPGFATRPPQFVGPSQIIVRQGPPMMTRHVIALHPAHMPGPPQPHPPPPPPHPPHNPELRVYVRPPSPSYPDMRGPYPSPFEGPPVNISNLLPAPPRFTSPEGPHHPFPPHNPGSPDGTFESGDRMFGMEGEGSIRETLREPLKRNNKKKDKKCFRPIGRVCSNLIRVDNHDPLS